MQKILIVLPLEKHAKVLNASKDARMITYFHDEYEENGLIRIVYSIFYPFNGFQTFGVETQNPKETFYFEAAPMGRHVGDWEHVTVFIKLKDDVDGKNRDNLNKLKNYELYCIYASQHDAYNVGLVPKYKQLYDEICKILN